MAETEAPSNDTKQLFRTCGTCSQTFGHLLNREFGHRHEQEEKALDALAGGILNQGHQCGMLWGAALAVGAESHRRHDDPGEAIAPAIVACQRVAASFLGRSQTLDCREITGCDLNSVLGLTRFIIRTMMAGMDDSQCFNLAEQWTPEAIEAATEGLSQGDSAGAEPSVSCASEVVRRMGGSEEETVMVAGFAGGLGLSGHGCGALAAAIWLRSLRWIRANPGKSLPVLNNRWGKRLLKVFAEVAGEHVRCADICGREFATVGEHSVYIRAGGCAEILDALAASEPA